MINQEIANCKLCKENLPHEPRPVTHFSSESKIAIIGQAPGRRVHETGIPWNDPSGDNLRKWLNVEKDTFYDSSLFAIVPMGFCYPGTGKSGDLTPMKICAPQWHQQIWDYCKNIELYILIGKYAQDYYLKQSKKTNLTNTVANFKAYLPKYFVLPHPSPRNNIWQKKNPWFKELVIPKLQNEIKRIKD